MSTEEDKFKHSRRILQKTSHVERQMDIAKSNGIPLDEAHKLHKKSAVTCGNSDCVMCGNPRKIFGELTQQEKRMSQDLDNTRMRHSNGIINDFEDDK
jgi:hypothetical protein